MINNRLGPCDPTVSVLIDRSYPIVREVYLHLKEIEAVFRGLDSIDFVSKHMDEIRNLQTAADRVNRVWESIDNIDALSAQIPAIQDIASHIAEITAIAGKLPEILEAGNKALEAQKIAEQCAAQALQSQQATEQAKAEVEKIVSSLNEIATQLHADIEAVKKAQAEATKAAEDAKKAAQEAIKAAESASVSALKAGYSFRYSALLTDEATMDIASLYPNDNAKIGDHVVNAKGEVFQIESIKELTFKVGFKITSIMGPKGPKGDGIKLSDAFPTYEDLLQKYPTGTPGQTVLVGNQIYVWSETLNKWVPSGELNLENVPPATIPWDQVTDKPDLTSFTEIANTDGVRVEVVGMTYSEIR